MSVDRQSEGVVPLRVQVNGTSHERTISARMSLADFLRGELGLKGTHIGCEQGVCGSCTVLLDDRPVRSCLVLAAQTEGSVVRTVESLAPAGELSALQSAFKENFGLQCGFCTPGFLMLLAGTAHVVADRESARQAISANLCRCTGYRAIVDSALQYGQSEEGTA